MAIKNKKFGVNYVTKNGGRKKNVKIIESSITNVEMTFKQVQEYVNRASKSMPKQIVKDGITYMGIISANVLLEGIGWRSSPKKSNAGDDVKLWDSETVSMYQQGEYEIDFSKTEINAFVITAEYVPVTGGCKKGSKFNDCAFDVIFKATNGSLPDKINSASKLKKVLELDRKDGVHIDSWVTIEKLLDNCSINIVGDFVRPSTLTDRKYNYNIKITKGHYTLKNNQDRSKMYHAMPAGRKLRVYYVSSSKKSEVTDVTVYDEENGFMTMSILEINKEKHNYKSPYFYVYVTDLVKNDGEQKQIAKEKYKKYMEDMEQLKKDTKNTSCYIDMSRFGGTINAMLFAFDEFTKGITEPENIDQIEDQWLNGLPLTGLKACTKGKYGKCFKYDFISRFGSIMASTKCLPMKAGKPTTISQEEWNDKMNRKYKPRYGIYKCKIEKSTDKQLNKIFCFNIENLFTHEEIESAFMIGLKVEIFDESPNCYIYNKEDLVPMKDIFGNFINFFFDLKNKKNAFGKPFLSQLHGAVTERYRIKVTAKDGEDVDVIDTAIFQSSYPTSDTTSTLVFSDSDKLFKTSWARTGFFVNAMARSKMTLFLFNNNRYKDVVYLNVDGFIMTKELKSNNETDSFDPKKLHGLKFEGTYDSLEVTNMNIYEKKLGNIFIENKY